MTTITGVRMAKPGDTLDIHIHRNGQVRTLTITAGPLPFHDVVGLE